ncbi:unnamed protein product [Calypogeia fissa]
MPITDRWMRRAQTDIADLGPIQIMREAFRQFWTYFPHFLLIQVTLILPVVGFFAAVQSRLLVYQLKALPLAPSAHYLLLAHDDGVSFLVPKSHERASIFPSGSSFSTPILFHPVVMISLFATFAFEIAQGLSTSAILLSVGFIYTDQKVSFFGILKSAIPILWCRLAVTTLYFVFASHFIILLETAALLALLNVKAGGVWITILKLVVGGAFGLLDLFLGVVFSVAVGVSVLEEAYGYAAFKKAMKLLDGKGRVAIWFHVVWSRTVPTVITFALNHRVNRVHEEVSKTGDYRSWSPTPLQEDYLNTVLFVSFTTLFWQLSSLCAGVQYVSFKAYHHENIADSRFFEERAQAGYRQIVDERSHVVTQVEAQVGVEAQVPPPPPAGGGENSMEIGSSDTEGFQSRPDS